MTKLDFPDAPSTGQQYGSSGTIWRWDGTRWGSTAGVAGERGQVAYAQITANQTGITAETTIAGLSVAVAMQAGRTYKITTQTRAASTVDNDRVVVRIKEGATTLALDDLVWHPGASPLMATQVVLTSATTGARTFSTSMQRSGGTGTSTAAAGVDHPAFILVEDITYEAGSGGPAPAGFADPAGRIEDYIGTTAPAGWIAMQGQTIAGADVAYPMLWSVVPVGMKSGTSLVVPDTRSRMSAGYNSGDASFNAIGKTGGAATHTLTTTELPSHTHPGTGRAAALAAGGNWTAPVLDPGAGANGWTTGSTGGGGAHNNLPPFITFLKIMRAY